jgi:amino acid transporter
MTAVSFALTLHQPRLPHGLGFGKFFRGSLGLIAALFNGFTYGLFSAIMPKTGGDYIYISRMIGMGYGFVASFGFTLAQLYGFALNCYWAFNQAVAPAIATFGMVRHDQRLVSLAIIVGQERTSSSARFLDVSRFHVFGLHGFRSK